MKRENRHPSSYQVILQPGTGTFTDRKSRFLSDVLPIRDLEDAREQLERIRKKYYDARHHCYGLRLCTDKILERSSDDGEPSGTAGRPILEVMKGEGLVNTLVVVTRYFGGTLLGTGGLVRAYTNAAKAGIQNAVKGQIRYGRQMSVKAAYKNVDALQYFFRQQGIIPRKIDYLQEVVFDLIIEDQDVDQVQEKIASISEGTAHIKLGKEGYFPIDKDV